MRQNVLIVVAALLAGCLSDPQSTEPRAGEEPARAAVPVRQHLFSAMIADPKTFNPIISTDTASSLAFGPVFDLLLRLNPKTSEMEPALAERWEVDETGTQCTLHLRKGVRWHDGEPLTADDVLFTFRAIYDERVPNSIRYTLNIDGKPIQIEKIDDHTVRLILPRPFAPLLNSLGIPVVPEHILGDALRAGTFAQQWGIDTAPEKLIGSGPYRMSKYVPAQYLQYQRNPHYWMHEGDDPLPLLEEQTIRIVPDQDTMYLKFLAGEIQMLLARPEDVGDLQSKREALRIELEEVGLDTGTLFVTFNRNPRRYATNSKRDPRLAWFTDKSFLRAIAHSIDRDSMVNNCLYGFGQPGVAHISPANQFFHNPSLTPYDYDLERARQTLADGGYLDRDGDGVLEDREGNRIEFNLYTNAGNRVREKISSILREDWSSLGMKVNYRALDFALLVEKLENTLDWDAVLIGFTGSLDPHNGANLLRSNGNLHLWHPNQTSPGSAWEAEIDRLVEEGSRELDAEKRRLIYWRIQEILHEELPMIQTVRQIQFFAWTASLDGFAPTVWGLYRPELIHFTK